MSYQPNSVGVVSSPVPAPLQDQITGEQTLPRVPLPTDYFGWATQRMIMTYFYASQQGLTATTVKCNSGNAGAVGMTLFRVGLYTIDQLGAGTLVASCVSDTTQLGTANTVFSKALSVSYPFKRGQLYAGAIVQVGTTPCPIIGSVNWTAFWASRPRLTGLITGQTDLPASFIDASVADIEYGPYIAFI